MEAFLLGIATNLASDLVEAGARRVRDAALGDAQVRALEAAFGRALTHLLAELSGADRLGGERELIALIEEQLGAFFASPEVAGDLVNAALAAEPVPVDRLRTRFEEMGFDPDTFLASFERSMGSLSQRLAELMRAEASEPDSPLHNLVEVSKLYALEEAQRELLRRVGPAGPTADELERESRARCKRRWALLGVPPEEADALARNPTVGAPSRKVREKLKEPVVVITAEVGSGKSLLLDRLMQRAIVRYRDREGAPLPVFVNATEVVEGKLREAVAKGTSALGDLAERGAAVFLDGLEEAGRARARQLLNEAHYLPDQLPNTTVVVSGRPIRELDEERERGQAFVLPPLSEEESLALVRRFSGDVQGAIGHRWPASLAEATRRPLFAALVGLDMRERRYAWDARSEGELLAHLVDRALSDAEDTAALRELRDLAVAVVESGTGYVRASDAGTGAEVLRLRRTGFVYQQGGTLRFSLQILSEWFAAQALELGEVDAEELASDFARLERWRYPLVMAVSNFGYERVLRIFAPVVRTAPAFASQVADAAFRRYGGAAAEGAVETAEEVTARFRETMGAWVEGLGPLASLFAPVRQDGSLGTLAITGWEPWEPGTGDYSWYAGEVDLPDVVPFSRVIESELRYGIPQRRYVVRRQAAWPWATTFKDLRGDLEKALKAQVLPASTSMLSREAAWRTAKELLYREKRRPRSIDRPIALGELEECLDGSGAWDGEWIWRPPPRSSLRPVLFGARHLVEEVRRLRDSGAAEMVSPVPAADLTVEEARERIGSGGTMFGWTLYSDDRLLERARLLVEEALRAYAETLETLLPTLKPHMPMAATLPGKVTGYLEGLGRTGYSGPRLNWYMEPLPAGSESVCELALETRPDEQRPEPWEEYDEHAYRARPKIASLRPQAAGWLTPRTGALFSGQLVASTPVTKTVYIWLWDDLRYAKWADRTNPWRM